MAKGFDLKAIFEAQTNEEQRKPGGSFRVVRIPIEKLKPSPENHYDVSDIEELVASIELHGLMTNLLVKPADIDGLHEIISGERRYRACKTLYDEGNRTYATIPCRISETGNTTMDRLMLLQANSTARVLSDYDRTIQAVEIKKTLRELKEEGADLPGRMRDIAASMLGVSQAQVGRMEKIAKDLAPDWMEAFRLGGIGITAAYDIATLSADQQAKAFEEYTVTGKVPPTKDAAAPSRQAREETDAKKGSSASPTVLRRPMSEAKVLSYLNQRFVNPPLDEDDLLAMVGKPVWCVINGWGVVGMRRTEEHVSRLVIGFAHGWEWAKDIMRDEIFQFPPSEN